jgi:hypothetical protein
MQNQKESMQNEAKNRIKTEKNRNLFKGDIFGFFFQCLLFNTASSVPLECQRIPA